MEWRRTDPVQPVDALIAIGGDAVDRLAAVMSRKPEPLRSLAVEQGQNWAAIFGAAISGEEAPLLPHLADATALYRVMPDIWLPVGVVMAVPEHARDELSRAMFDHHRVTPPAIIIPCFADGDRTGEAALYLIRNPISFDHSPLAHAERRETAG